MGVVFAKKQRYMKGKVPEKYWQEDMWPKVEELFEKWHIDRHKGLDMFMAFCAMDADAGGTVDLEECFAYLGGARTKFTERIWHADAKITEDGEYEEGLDFEEFAVVCWNYCTISPFCMAKLVFEILDVESANELERPDIECLYRMLYDCDEHDEYYVKELPWSPQNTITKAAFANYVSSNKHFIQPCLDYQRRLRRKFGGFILWETLAGHRRRKFAVFDEQSATMEEAIVAIVKAEDPNRKQRKLQADRALAEAKEAADAEAKAAEEELRAIERAKEEEARKAELSAEDRFMKLYWMALDTQRDKFEKTDYTVDHAYDRHEDKQEMYETLDKFKIASDEYWETKDEKELALQIGTDDDHTARYNDLMKTSEGRLEMEHVVCEHALKSKAVLLEQQRVAKARGGVIPQKTSKEYDIDNALSEIEKKKERIINNRILIAAGALKSKVKAAQIRPVDFKDEKKVMKSACTKIEIKAAEKEARDEIFEATKAKAVASAEAFIAKRKKERATDLVRVEFEMATTYGSRITRWEMCWDPNNEKYVYVNLDTLEVIHQKTAICEKCDAIFDQSDKKCKTCDSFRSSKNQLLYRPLGYKDIRID